jgi:hypothetical protein
MNIPGFTAEASLNRMSGHYHSEASFDNGTKVNQVHMQKPNNQNTAGGACYGSTSGTIIRGTYDSLGRCCTAPPNGFPFCIDCDSDKCYDRATRTSAAVTSGIFQRAIFAPF